MLFPGHRMLSGGVRVVVADQMQDPVHEQVLELGFERDAETACLSLGHLDADHDVTEDGRCKECGGAIEGRFELFKKAFGPRRIPVRLGVA